MTHWPGCTVATFGLLALSFALPALGQDFAPPPRDLLEVVPDDCWGFVLANHLDSFDAQLAEVFKTMEIPALGPAELFRSRLQLGPQIPTSGPLAIVLLPAPTFADFGLHTVLVVPCADVEKWLAEFTTVRVEERLWRSELVWGPTWVAAVKGFAVLGTTEEAVRALRSAPRSIAARLQGARLSHIERNAACAWVNWAAVHDSPAGGEWLASGAGAGQQSVFGTALLSSSTELVAQVDTVLMSISPGPAGIRLTATITARPGSPLANLVAVVQSQPAADLQRLPNLPYVLAGAAGLAPGQAGTLADELDKMLASPTAASATHPEQLARLRELLRAAAGDVRAVRWSALSLPPDPQGMVAVLALVEVPDAAAWIERAGQVCAVLEGQLFRDPALNTLYKSARFEGQSDTIDSTPVALLDVQLQESAPAGEAPESVTFRGVLGGNRMAVRLAAVDGHTVALCIGGQPHEMGRLIAAARGREAGLGASAGLQAASGLLPAVGDALLAFSPEELIRLTRALARVQDKVRHAPQRIEPSGAVCAARLAYEHPLLTIEAVIPTQVLRALKALLLRRSVPEMELPPEG